MGCANLVMGVIIGTAVVSRYVCLALGGLMSSS